MTELPVQINVLGTNYLVQERTMAEDKNLSGADAYCDHSSKEIVINKDYYRECTIENPDYYLNKIVRHEVVHAFLYESGFDGCATFNDDHFEQMVDWFAIQHEKMHAIYKQLGIVED